MKRLCRHAKSFSERCMIEAVLAGGRIKIVLEKSLGYSNVIAGENEQRSIKQINLFHGAA